MISPGLCSTVMDTPTPSTSQEEKMQEKKMQCLFSFRPEMHPVECQIGWQGHLERQNDNMAKGSSIYKATNPVNVDKSFML